MIIACIKKNENDKSFYYISVFSINKYFKLYNYELNKIIIFFQKEKEQKLLSKETSQICNGYELQNEEVGNDKGFVLKVASPLNLTKYMNCMENKKILSKAYLIYEINAFIINEIKILINTVSLNKSNDFNLLKLIDNKYKKNDTNSLINKGIKVPNSVNNNENDNNNNYNDQKMFLIYLIKYFCSNVITSSYFQNEIQNILDFYIKFNKKKFSNLEVSKNNLSYSFNKKKNQLFKIEKSELKIFGKNINFPELIEIKPKGVINRNGCCYLNAAIQCFYHCPKITSFFTLNREMILKKGGPISLGYLEVVEEFSKNKKNYISIKNFRNLLIENDESFNGNNGNDSKDVILLLLYSIQNELGGEEPDLNLDIDNTKEHLLFQDLIMCNRSVNSIIIENFCFCEKKTSICKVCGEKYFYLANQYFLTFSLKNIYEHYHKNKNEVLSIEECLTFNCFQEADFQIKCNKCNKLQDSLTIISFATIPYYLIIILDRGINEEFDCNFDFKEQIDLADLYYPVQGEQRESNLKYTLIAGTILHGMQGSGHTFTFAKHFDGSLYIFNDTQVEKTTFKDIKNEKVYLLFYQRLNNSKEEKISKF